MPVVKERKDCPNVAVNDEDCACGSTSCERHGVCCVCIEYHRNDGSIPACLR